MSKKLKIQSSKSKKVPIKPTKLAKEILRKLPAEDHYIIWNNLFEIEKDAQLIRNKLASDFRLHAEIIKMCANGLNEPTN